MEGSLSPILVDSSPKGLDVLSEVLRGSSDAEAEDEVIFDVPSRREANSEALAQSWRRLRWLSRNHVAWKWVDRAASERGHCVNSTWRTHLVPDAHFNPRTASR